MLFPNALANLKLRKAKHNLAAQDSQEMHCVACAAICGKSSQVLWTKRQNVHVRDEQHLVVSCHPDAWHVPHICFHCQLIRPYTNESIQLWQHQHVFGTCTSHVPCCKEFREVVHDSWVGALLMWRCMTHHALHAPYDNARLIWQRMTRGATVHHDTTGMLFIEIMIRTLFCIHNGWRGHMMYCNGTCQNVAMRGKQ